jgi:hypothetical protein
MKPTRDNSIDKYLIETQNEINDLRQQLTKTQDRFDTCEDFEVAGINRMTGHLRRALRLKLNERANFK